MDPWAAPTQKKSPQERGGAYLPASGTTPMDSAGPRQPLQGGGGVLGPWPCACQGPASRGGAWGHPPWAPPSSPWARPDVCTGLREMDGLSPPPFLPDGSGDQQAWGPAATATATALWGASSGSHLGLGVREGVLTGWGHSRALAPLPPLPPMNQTRPGFDLCWPRNRTVPAPQPCPGQSLPTIPGGSLSLGTNATQPECNQSNKQSLWQRERAVEPCLAAN